MSHPFGPDGQPTRTPTWRRYLGFWGARVDADVDEELAFHLEMRVRDYIERGFSEREARAAAYGRLGENIGRARAECVTIGHRRQRRLTRHQTMETLIQDLRFAVRTLGRQKGWTAVAIVTLALGIGANTAVFSVVNDLLLDPLRYPDPNRLVLIMRSNPKSGIALTPTRAMRDAWRTNAHSFTGFEGVSGEDVTISGANGEPRVLRAVRVDPEFLGFAGAKLVAGRNFRADETTPSAAPVTIVGERLAREQFGDPASAVGKKVKLDTLFYSVVGVFHDGLRLPSFNDHADLLIPLLPDAAFFSGPVVARLKPGISIEAGEKELRAIGENLDGVKGGLGKAQPFVISAKPPGSIGNARETVVLLAWSVALLLLIACANVAHLLLARAAAREREIAVRASLGAGRGRLIRQLLTESMLLAAGGCVLGLLVGSLGLRLIVSLRPQNIDELANAHIDGRVLAVTIIISAITGIGFGLTAAIHSVRSGGFAILRSSIGGTASKSRHRLRSLLVITEMALSVILLVGATLLIRTVINLHRIDPGFDTTNLYALPFTLPESRYKEKAAREAFAADLLERAKRLPGYEAVTVADNAPTRAGIIIGTWEAEGASTSATPRSEQGAITTMNSVRPEYFSVMKIRFVAGHTFDDGSVSRNEVIVSASLAQQMWPNANAVGRRLRMATSGAKPNDWETVIGVVPNVSLISLHDPRNTPAVYYPSKTGLGWSGATLLVRAAAGHSPYTDLRRLSLAMDRNLAVPAVLRVSDLLNDTVASQRFMMALLTTFALLAVCLSAIGLYGVIAYMVSQTTREIGVRIALGARRMDIVRLVMFQGAGLAAAGMVIGLVGATWGVGLLKKTLYGIQPTDPASFAFGALILLGVAVVACLVPTRRAVRVDPVIAMRAE